MTARLIALDWGSSSLRATLMADGGRVLAERRSDSGATRLAAAQAGFEEHLRALAGDWIAAHPGIPIAACGMVGSAHGWLEAPYAACPVALAALPAHCVTVAGSGGLSVRIVPGVSSRAPGLTPDVMRGEETQIAGLLAAQPELAARASVVLPGTHSKWVDVRDGRIAALATRMTGELFAVLSAHSVLGRSIETSTVFQAEAFDAGVRAGAPGHGADLARRLFGVRALGLFGEWPAVALGDYLSGLLIGSEIAAALAQADAAAPRVLMGEPALCERYARAFGTLGVAAPRVVDNTAAAGLWWLAQTAGWLQG